jgi:hypothetical protein
MPVQSDAPTDQMQLHLKYYGPALESGRMSAKDLGPAIIAMAGLLERTSQVLYPEATPLRVEVKGNFKRGSFDINFVAGSAGTGLFENLTLEQLDQITSILGISALTALGGLIHWLRKLRGEKPEPVRDERGNVNIIVHGGEIDLTLNQQEFNVLADPEIRESLDGVLQPLRLPGVEGVEISPPRRRHHNRQRIERGEVKYFAKSTTPDRLVDIHQQTAWLVLKAPDFGFGNKWKFDMGGATIWADIRDPVFLARVEQDIERFGSRDLFHVEMQVTVRQSGTDISYDYAITRVIQHRPMLNDDGQQNLLPPG